MRKKSLYDKLTEVGVIYRGSREYFNIFKY